MPVAQLRSDTLTGFRTPLCWTPLARVKSADVVYDEGSFVVVFRR